MLNHIWRRALRQLFSALQGHARTKPIRRARGLAARLEELEARLAPAAFAVDAQLRISSLDSAGATETPAHAVVFFESGVANFQVLRQGLGVGTDGVLLDGGGDGLREMAAFLANRHDLTA